MSSDAPNSRLSRAEREALFRAEAHRQSCVAAESASEQDDQAFIDAISDLHFDIGEGETAHSQNNVS